MDIVCDKCKTVSSIPDAAIPDEGITFECPHCSAQLFAKPNLQQEEDLFGISSTESSSSTALPPNDLIGGSLDSSIDNKNNSPSLSPNALDLDFEGDSLAVDLKALAEDDISPSMLYNTEEIQKQADFSNNNNPPKKSSQSPTQPPNGTPLEHQKIQEQPVIQKNTLDAYLSSRSASVQQQKKTSIF